MIDVPAYQQRIGYTGPLEPTLPVLRSLHLAHLIAVPFENLDIHLGRPILLDEAHLFEKVVRRRRGGFCYELNGLFAALLREIGFDVTMLGARFPSDHEEGTPELDHLTLLVRCQDEPEPVLADVAAGRGSFPCPLRTDTREPQAQPMARSSFRLLPEGEACRVWRQPDGGDWEREYLFTWRPRQYREFEEGSRFHQTSPRSHFTRMRLVTRVTPAGRITLTDRRLITTTDGVRSEEELHSEADYVRALQDHFGIDLDI